MSGLSKQLTILIIRGIQLLHHNPGYYVNNNVYNIKNIVMKSNKSVKDTPHCSIFYVLELQSRKVNIKSN